MPENKTRLLETSHLRKSHTKQVVTTAALPWRTGTAVNPALRAAHLAARGLRVTLLVPWLPPGEQPAVYPPGQVFQTREAQAEHVVSDARKRAGLLGDPASRFRVAWYEGRYFPALGSILPTGDVTGAVPADAAAAGCAVVLEEPEHLTWFAHRTRWTARFAHVVGVMHTNYLSYVASGLSGGSGGAVGGAVASSALCRINKWTCRLHCHKVIKLSDAVQQLPRQVTCNVHGVASCFLEQGAAAAAAAAKATAGAGAVEAEGEGEERAPARSPFTKGAYFIGKAVWGKGWRELVELLDHVQKKEEQRKLSPDSGGGGGGAGANGVGDANGGVGVNGVGGGRSPPAPAPSSSVVDLYGGGEDLDAIRREAEGRGLRVCFKGPADHSDASVVGPYRVFLNPSTSDVVATTTAEALAMGKWAVVEELPCNEFFRQFGEREVVSVGAIWFRGARAHLRVCAFFCAFARLRLFLRLCAFRRSLVLFREEREDAPPFARTKSERNSQLTPPPPITHAQQEHQQHTQKTASSTARPTSSPPTSRAPCATTPRP